MYNICIYIYCLYSIYVVLCYIARTSRLATAPRASYVCCVTGTCVENNRVQQFRFPSSFSSTLRSLLGGRNGPPPCVLRSFCWRYAARASADSRCLLWVSEFVYIYTTMCLKVCMCVRMCGWLITTMRESAVFSCVSLGYNILHIYASTLTSQKHTKLKQHIHHTTPHHTSRIVWLDCRESIMRDALWSMSPTF